MLDANKLLAKGIAQVIEAGITPGKISPNVIINNRAKRRFGRCSRVPFKDYDYEIELNGQLLHVEEKKALNTLVHEILHSCEGCQNHGPIWKRHARKMNAKFGYDISTTSSYEKMGLEKPKARYVVKCQSCGNEIGRQQRSKLITQTNRYKCTCGGKFKLL